MQRPRDSAYWLAPHSLLSLLIEPEPQSRDITSHIRKMIYRFAYSLEFYGGIFLIKVPLVRITLACVKLT